MSDLRKAAKISLDALEEINKLSTGKNAISLPAEIDTAMDALRAALATVPSDYPYSHQPVAWHYTNNGGGSCMHWGPSAKLDADFQAAKDYPRTHKVTPLYTAPPQREPLTDKEIHDCFQQRSRDKTKERRLITRAIERAHGIGGKYER